jgi:transposase
MSTTGLKYPLVTCSTCGKRYASNQVARHERRHSDPLSLLVATPEQVEEIQRLYLRHSMKEVAELTNWSIATVQRVLEKSGAKRRPAHAVLRSRRVDNETLLKTAQLYGRGLSMDEVADLMDCTRSTVCRRLHSVGATIRKRGGRPRAQDRRALV